jgi:predicted Zn-dependent peptidase
MRYKTYTYEKLDEKLHVYEHGSGLKVFIIPKKGYQKKYATYSTYYGSINNRFFAENEDKETVLPEGVAHFLEHKLFDQEYGNVMDKFSELGANPNAYTGFMQTVYLFSCNQSFDKCFDILVNFVQNPYITDESIERERGIIGQEIRMYNDNPDWRVFFNLLGAFYVNNPVKDDIAGSIESIARIDKEILMKCYKSFYTPKNMIVLVAGDVEPEQVIDIIDKNVNLQIESVIPKKTKIIDEKQIRKSLVEQSLEVSTPIFQMGFRDNSMKRLGEEGAEYEIAVKLLMNMIFGKSGDIYNELYNMGIINSTFSYDFINEEEFAFSIIGGESAEPKKVKDIIIEKLDNLMDENLSLESFNRIKKSMYGSFVKQFNSVERIANNFISVYFRDINIFEYPDVYDKITFEKIKEVYKSHFIKDNFALSIINPL